MAGLCAAILLGACETPVGPPEISAARTIKVDVRNTIFNAPGLTYPAIAGLGATEVKISVTTEPGPSGGGTWDAVLPAAGIDNGATANGYTQVSIPVEGVLKKVRVEAAAPTGTFSVETSEYDGTYEFLGWDTFANIEKLKLSYFADPDDVSKSALSLNVAPRGGANALLIADIGALGSGNPSNRNQTDRSATLASLDLALRPQLSENLSDISYDVYYAFVDEELSVKYNADIGLGGTYYEDPWEPDWTMFEIMFGKSIAGKTYTLKKMPGNSFSVVNPMGDGLTSLLIDLPTLKSNVSAAEFLLVTVVVHYGTENVLSAALDVACLDIE